jgi:hypothetical protein
MEGDVTAGPGARPFQRSHSTESGAYERRFMPYRRKFG